MLKPVFGDLKIPDRENEFQLQIHAGVSSMDSVSLAFSFFPGNF